MILPHFLYPSHFPTAGGRRRRRRRVRAAPQDAAARSRSKKAVRSPPSSPTKASRKKVDVGLGGDEPESVRATSGGAGRTKRWAGGTPPLRPNRGGGLRRFGKELRLEVPALDGTLEEKVEDGDGEASAMNSKLSRRPDLKRETSW